jgi:hypothetical protein
MSHPTAKETGERWRTGEESKEPWDGKEVRGKADGVEMCGQLRVVIGDELTPGEETLLHEERVVRQEEVSDELLD